MLTRRVSLSRWSPPRHMRVIRHPHEPAHLLLLEEIGAMPLEIDGPSVEDRVQAALQGLSRPSVTGERP